MACDKEQHMETLQGCRKAHRMEMADANVWIESCEQWLRSLLVDDFTINNRDFSCDLENGNMGSITQQMMVDE